MPTTTWSAARADISRDLGMVTSAPTTNITTNQIVVSTHLQRRYPKDDYFVGWYCYFENSADTGNHVFTDEWFVTDYVASTGTLTVAGPALKNASGATDFTLHRVSPVELHRFYNRARQDLYPQIGTFIDVATGINSKLGVR